MNICFVTAECIGPFRNGGIGTSTTGLAGVLAVSGHTVTLFYTRGIHLTRGSVKYWQNYYSRAGINFVALRARDLAKFTGPMSTVGYTVPCAVLEYLSSQDFDVVHFNDTDAEGFLALAAHKYCNLLPESRFVLALHSPREWVYEYNLVPALVPVDVIMHFTERLSLSLADLVWSPSRYLLDWLQSKNRLPADNIICQQYVMPSESWVRSTVAVMPTGREGRTIRKLVFFGRLEERKGLRLFLEVVDSIQSRLHEAGIEIVFLGRSVMIDGVSSELFISRYAKNWGLDWKVITTYGQSQAVEFLSAGNAMAVIASSADNSPCTIYEVIEASIPFIAARTGGIPELIHEEDIPNTLFDYNVASLKEMILNRLDGELLTVRPRISREENLGRWLAIHQRLRDEVTINTMDKNPLLPINAIVVIEDRDSAEALGDTISSLLRSDIEIRAILVISRSARNIDSDQTEIHIVEAAECDARLSGMIQGMDNVGVFFLYSGVNVDRTTLRELAVCMTGNNVDGLSPSLNTGSGQRLDSIGGSVAMTFIHGPVSTGMTVLGANAVNQAMLIKADSNAGHFFSLPDRAIVAGCTIYPYPKPVGNVSKTIWDSFQPQMTVHRIDLYTQVDTANLRMLVMLAAGHAGQGMNNTLSRYWGYRLLRSRIGFMFPWLSLTRDLFRRISD